MNLNMKMTVPFMTYFENIQLYLPDEMIGLIISFVDLNAYIIMCKLNAYLRTITQDDWKYLMLVNQLRLNTSNHIYINTRILHCFINCMTYMHLMYIPAKTNALDGQDCKHNIEHHFNGRTNIGTMMFFNKKMLNGEQRYITHGKFQISTKYHYVDRLSTVLALILSGFKRKNEMFYVKKVRLTERLIFDNRHLKINKMY